jgi:phosphoadenosine phosphosulfate reductase
MKTASLRTDLSYLNQEFRIDSVRLMIQRGLSLGQRPFMSTKFGPESAVLLHLLAQAAPGIPVVWVDTGYNTRATLHYAEFLRQRLDLNLRIFRPRQDTLAIPPELSDPQHAAFTRRVKLEPFERALETLQPDVWFSSLRREQTAYRAGLNIVSRSNSGLLKVAPLLEWKEADMQAYLAHYDLDPDFDYAQADYYDPTKGEARRECGLHLSF